MVLNLRNQQMAVGALIAIASTLSVTAASAAPVPTKPSAVAAPSNAAAKQFVQDFYNWYVITKENEPDVRGTEAALQQKKELFDALLYKQLKEDDDAAANSPGELVGLDFDPFVNANGLIYNKYQTGTATMNGSSYRVPVYGIEKGKKTPKPVLEAEVANKNGHCVFSNFHYGQSEIPENENLISVLNVLKKDRQKTSK